MVTIGSGAPREIDDMMLIRFACYLIAQNGDPKKQEIAFAQTYFAIQTRRAELIEQVKRNSKRFPEDFRYRLTQAEKSEVVANCDHLKKLKFSKALPYAFTEHGALMASNVLNSDEAVRMSVFIIRAFIKQREALSANESILRRIAYGQIRHAGEVHAFCENGKTHSTEVLPMSLEDLVPINNVWISDYLDGFVEALQEVGFQRGLVTMEREQS